MNKKKILFIGPTARSIYTFRTDLINEMLSRQWEVGVMCMEDEFSDRIRGLGVNLHIVEGARFMSPLKDLKYLFMIWRIFRKNNYNLVHTFTIKPNLYGSIANVLSLKKAKVVSLVEGFGFLYGYDDSFKTKAIRNLYFLLNKVAFRFVDKVWFINKDDEKEMVSRKVLRKDQSVFIKSIGVNLDLYNKKNINLNIVNELKNKFNINQDTVVVSLVSRMNQLKGISELIQAGEILLSTNKNVLILMVGEIQNGSPYTMSEKDFLKLPTNVKWVGFTENINEINYLTDIACLPTYYREGVPRSLIEAMCFNKPLIVTDSVGCREIVEDGFNGYRVPVRDPIVLAEKINELSLDPKKREAFGLNSRKICENELDVTLVNSRVMKELYEI